MLNRIVMLLGALALGGCAAVPALPMASSILPAGTANADFHSATAVKLHEANFAMMKTNVVGHSTGFALLGIITVFPARYSAALDQVYGQAGLQAGRPQTLVNVVAERSSRFYLLFSRPRVTIRADVVEFQPYPATGAPPRPAEATRP